MTQQSSQPVDNDAELDRFDPSRFRIEVAIPDPLIEAIETDEEVTQGRDHITGLFSIVPLAAVPHFPPTARVLLALLHLPCVQAPDLKGGWYKLRTSVTANFHLRDKNARFRALASLEKAGVIEVQRKFGTSPHIRLAHRDDFQHIPGSSRARRGVVRMRIREL